MLGLRDQFGDRDRTRIGEALVQRVDQQDYGFRDDLYRRADQPVKDVFCGPVQDQRLDPDCAQRNGSWPCDVARRSCSYSSLAGVSPVRVAAKGTNICAPSG
jgi:hypothetical protein